MNLPFTTKKVPKDFLDNIVKETEHTPDSPELDRCDHHHLFVFDDLQQGRPFHSALAEGQAKLIATAFTESMFHCWKRMPDPPQAKIPDEEPEHFAGAQDEVFAGTGSTKRSLGFAYPIPTRKKQVVLPELPPITVEQPLVVPLPKYDQNDTTEWTEQNRTRERLNHWAKIKGELFKVPSEHYYKLDKLMANGRVFQRTRVSLEVPLRMVYTDGDKTDIQRIVHEQGAYMYVGISEFWEPQLDGGFLFQPLKIYNNSSLSRKYYCYTKLEDQD